MKTKPCLLVIGCLCAAISAHAQGTLILTPSSVGDITGGGHQNFTFPTPSTPLANYNSVQVTFKAPDGYAWHVLSGHALECVVAYSAPGDDDYPTASYSFDFAPGMSSSVSAGISERLSESSFGFDAVFQFGDTVEFTELDVTLQYYPGHDWQIAQRPMSPFDQAYFYAHTAYISEPTDTQRLWFVPIPEPGAATLAGLGVGIAVVSSSVRRTRCRTEA